jgi:hypothetical protein
MFWFAIILPMLHISKMEMEKSPRIALKMRAQSVSVIGGNIWTKMDINETEKK